ncbi:MAG: hypothetical protein ACK5JI_09970 [Azonexus sp.]
MPLRHFSLPLPLANASLHGQLLCPATARRLFVIAKPHRIAINDPVAQYFLQAGEAILAAELLTEREAAYAEATQDTARLTARLLQLLEFIDADADTQNLDLVLLASEDVSPAALRAAARRDAQVAALVAYGGLIDRAGREALQLLRAPLLFLCAAEDHYARAAWQRARIHLSCPYASQVLAPGAETAAQIAAWLTERPTQAAHLRRL